MSVYLYDVENRLVEKRVQTTGTCASLSYAGALQGSLRYDPAGRLHEVLGYTGGTLASTVRFLYDGDALVAEYDGAGTMLVRHVHGADAGADDPLLSYNGSATALGSARFLYRDSHGSIVLRADTAGTSTAINTYDEYGIPGAANVGRFQYTGQAWLPELGMYYYKARLYSPTLGRFLQVDPIGYEDQVNLYAYVGDDPVNHSDFSGQESDKVQISLGGLSVAVSSEGVSARADMGVGDVSVSATGSGVTASAHALGASASASATAVGVTASASDAVGNRLSASVSGSGVTVSGQDFGKSGTVSITKTGVSVKSGEQQGPRFARGALRQKVLDKGRQPDGSVKCAYCGKSTATTSDHVQAYSKGDATVLGNLEPACLSCNASKGNKDLGTEWTPPNER